jgi:hypothetical protein
MKPLHLQLISAAILGLTACTTTGTGVGSSPTGKVQAVLTWKGGNDSGTLTAKLNSGETYSGMYLQITHDTRVDELGGLSAGWGIGWRDWPGWDVNPGPEFITQYSGRVVANLTGPNGSHLRCRLQLASPAEGMAGGGQGQCQMPNGQAIDTTFPAA